MYIPKLVSWSPTDLWDSRIKALNNHNSIISSVHAMCSKADGLLQLPNVNVTNKSKFAINISGDPHFYTSLSSYFWENEEDPNGPWVYKDGQYNNEQIVHYDFLNWELMVKRVVSFTLAWWCTNRQDYAEAAISQIREWFIDPETLMYPNLDYSQTIPNFSKGSSAGIIDLNQVDQLINSICLIECCSLWTHHDSVAMKKWCTEMVEWLTTSAPGRKESINTNNHGIYFDKILVCLACYSGNLKLAYSLLSVFSNNRIFKQIDSDGKMPHEMERANAYHYLHWTLSGYVGVALVAENLGINLWSVTSVDGISMKRAFDWAIGYIDGSKKWEYAAKFDPSMHNLVELFWRSSLVYDGEHEKIFNEIILPLQNAKHMSSHMFNIIHPRNGLDYANRLNNLSFKNFS